MVYRTHIMAEKGQSLQMVRKHFVSIGRCALAICSLDDNFKPGSNQWLDLTGPTGVEHHEDPRFFMFRGEPHLTFTQTRFYTDRPYTCVIKYARLTLKGNRWKIAEVFWPKYGNNDNQSVEKNWAFFEHGQNLYCTYCDWPNHRVLKLDGEKVIDEWVSPAAAWEWGQIRGGTSPIPYGAKLLTFFHSSMDIEPAPFYRRYFSGAYLMNSTPPFAITDISRKPFLAGSELDGHAPDPRRPDGWKPKVVFPGGCISDGSKWLVSFGVNDWQCAIARLTVDHLMLCKPDGSDLKPRFFRCANGRNPTEIKNVDGSSRWITWQCPPARHGSLPEGFLKTLEVRLSEELMELRGVVETTESEYRSAIRNL